MCWTRAATPSTANWAPTVPIAGPPRTAACWARALNWPAKSTTNPTPAPPLRRRPKESHLSLRRLLEALRANDLRSASKIVLVHLSDERSDEARMVEAIHEATGVETVAASSGADIALNPTPF